MQYTHLIIIITIINKYGYRFIYVYFCNIQDFKGKYMFLIFVYYFIIYILYLLQHTLLIYNIKIIINSTTNLINYELVGVYYITLQF